MQEDKPSNTALMVAAGVQLLPQNAASEDLLPTDARARGARLLAGASPRLARMLDKPWFRALSHRIERAVLPGTSLHLALRKRALREYARAQVAAGCRQVIVLGAGLDTLCMALQAAFPALCCIEIDHPASQAVKRRAAGEEGSAIVFLAADLAQQTLADVLARSPAFRADAATLFIAEGLLMYVPLPAVAALFAQMSHVAPASRVAFTWLAPQTDGRPNFESPSRLVDFWLRLRGEPFVSGMARDELAGFLRPAGFVIDGVDDTAALLTPAERAALASVGPPLAGEYIAYAHRAVTGG